MLDIYLLTLALSIGIGVPTTLALLALSKTERFFGLFHIRGVQERPRWGGAVFLIVFAATPFIASALSDQASDFFTPKSGSFLGFVAAVSLVFLVGFLDDVRLASARLRSLVFVAAGIAVYAAGYRIDDVGLPFGPTLSFGPLGLVLTVGWVFVTTNAINIIDGRDGVALGVAIFAAVTMATVAGHSHHPTVALLLVALAGAGLGFLPFNMPPASAYVGDSGAYVMGFVIGALSIRAATGPTDEVFIAVPLIALGFPILDIGLSAFRRLLQHKHPAIGDEDHIHHRLEQAGAGPRGLLVVMYGLAAIFSGGAILLHYIDSLAVEGAVFVTLVVTVATTLLRLGYIVTIWNSASIVWLRQRITGPETLARRSTD
jgi:UDP-GlcNAc:undecaprenyl-phosphate GlcNAc-1-phosphate transferase